MDSIVDIAVGLLTLTALEIVLGIDNIIFVSILAGKLPAHLQKKARRNGLGLALISRILLLLTLAWLVGLTTPIFEFRILGNDLSISGRDLILIAGGIFLLGKSTREIHEKLEGEDGEVSRRIPPTFAKVLIQIMLLDIVFSLDSVITAVGMVQNRWVMVTAVILAMIVMLLFVEKISRFVEKHPTIKMLALSFLLLIGCMLIAEGFGKHVPKGYLYFAMAFSMGVEMLNIRARSKQKKVELRQPYR